LASAQGDCVTRNDHHLQPLLLRRSAGRAGPSEAAEKPKDSTKPNDEKHLGRTLRRYESLRTLPDTQRNSGTKILSAHFETRTEETISGTTGRFEEELEVLNGGHR